MNNLNNQESFSWWRKNFFPIHLYESHKVIPYAIMFTAIVFIYTVCRQSKDFFMLGMGEGSNVLPVAKVLVMVAAVALGFVHSYVSRKYSHYKAFLISFLPFIAFYIFFAIFFKHLHMVHMSPETIMQLSLRFPPLRYFFLVIGNWAYCLNYIFSEMFGSFILSATFWQLASFYSTSDEAKRFYPFYALCAQLGSFLAGKMIKRVGIFFIRTNNRNHSVFLITLSLVVAAIIIVGALTYFFKVALADPVYAQQLEEKAHKKKAKVVSNWRDSIRNLRESPTLILACLLSVWYGVAATSMETYWKGKAHEFCGNEGRFLVFYGNYFTYTSIATFLITILAAPLVRSLPWLVPALVTPIVVLIASTFLFGSSINFISKILVMFFSVNPLTLAVMVGAAALMIFKACKYALHDSTKEMYVRSQSEDNIIQMKSIETFTGRLGKGGSAVLQTTLLLIPGVTMDSMSPLMWIMTIIMGTIWILSVISINRDMQKSEDK